MNDPNDPVSRTGREVQSGREDWGVWMGARITPFGVLRYSQYCSKVFKINSGGYTGEVEADNLHGGELSKRSEQGHGFFLNPEDRIP
ncbi:hypothetical protein PM082_000576 [Marasmius tenuissimus]|nr:hypothetical protein PM082_000576 [Marasmius tenuissimus]